MALSWRTGVSSSRLSGTSVAVNISSFSDGDLMFVAITAQSGAGSCSPPSGWTELYDNVSSSAVLGTGYYKIKTSGDGSTATFTLATGGFFYAWCAAAVYDTGGTFTVSASTSVGTNMSGADTAINLPAVPAPGATGYLGVAIMGPRN